MGKRHSNTFPSSAQGEKKGEKDPITVLPQPHICIQGLLPIGMKACPWWKRHRGLGSKYWIFPSFLTQGIFQQHQSSGWTGKAAVVVAEWRWCSARGFKGSVQPCPSIPEEWQQGMPLCCGSVNPSLCWWLLGWGGKLAGLHNPRWNSCCPALVKMWGLMKLSGCALGQKWTWPGLWFLHEWFCKKQQLCSKFSARSSVRSWKKEAGYGYQQVGKTEVKFEGGTLWENWNVSSWQQHLGWDSRVQAPEGQQQEGISSQKEHSKKELHFLSIWGGESTKPGLTVPWMGQSQTDHLLRQ